MSRLLIQFSHLFKSFGSITLFEDISLSVHEGDIFCLIGENGAGKSTLIKLLSGEVVPDTGYFKKAPRLTIGLLPQEIQLISSDIKVRDYIDEGPLLELERQMAASLDDPERVQEWGMLHERYEQLGGYRRAPMEKILQGLKLESALLDLPMASLSSGQRVRAALAKALIDNPDLLLLDEPTNHLDEEMVTWLEEVLRVREGATIIVSHDRIFLNATCNQLIEINSGKLSCFGGNYDFYLGEQDRLIQRKIKEFEAREEEIRILKQSIKAVTFSNKKVSPAKDRNIMAYDRRGEQHQKSLQRNLDVMKSRLAEIEAHPLSHPKPKSISGLKFLLNPLGSAVAIELDHMSKSFGEKSIFSDFYKVICKGDRILLTGPNGSGKTTLLKCIAGLLPLDAGKVRCASTVKIAYLDQDVELLPMEKTPLEYFNDRFNLHEEDVRRQLHMAGMGGAELLGRPFSTLSVGQRKRLMLLSLIQEKPNVLLLDEPTNHLDLMTLEAFEKALLNFEGALLAISHDSTFIEKIATQVWRL